MVECRMIEFRNKRPIFGEGKAWTLHPNKRKPSDFAFNSFEYRINGREFAYDCVEFREEFERHLIWKKLSD